jgi:tripartite-type tricarboxylate transporter receptor subunit TctC
MKIPRRSFLHLAAGAVALPAVSRIARAAQAYPTRPVRIIVPFAAGGPSDTVARLVAQKLTENLGRQFYVENQVGAGGNLGMGNAARAAPDGYTILFASSSYVVNPSLYPRVPYDPDKDFAPLTVTADAPNILIVHPSVSASTIRELVDLVKDGKLRALAVAAKARLAALSNVPTLDEAGFKGQEADTFQAMLIQTAVPKDIRDLLHREIVKVLTLPDVKARLEGLGFDVVANSQQEFGAQIKEEIVKWRKVIRAANIKLE